MTRIKLCGLSRPEDIAAVNEARPDYCGFIVNYPKSRRNVAPETVRILRTGLAAGIEPVGVFVDSPPEIPAALLNDGTLSAVQLHGHEEGTYLARLRELAPGKPIWKAFIVRSPADVEAARRSPADVVLLDNGRGGGTAFDWTLVRDMGRPWLLAGGLTPETLPTAVRTLHPWGVDLSGGVETDGVKDREKMIAAVRAVRETG